MMRHRSKIHTLTKLTALLGLAAALGFTAQSAVAQSDGVVECLKGCRTAAKACREPVYEAREVCAHTCRDDMKAALQACKTADDPATCIGNAFAAAETCHDGCGATAQLGHETCFTGTNTCILGCTTPELGACIVGCREITRACRQSASDIAHSCKDNCRDAMVTTLEGCPSAAEPGVCAKAARDTAKACKAPCITGLKSDQQTCKQNAKSCKGTCTQ